MFDALENKIHSAIINGDVYTVQDCLTEARNLEISIIKKSWSHKCEDSWTLLKFATIMQQLEVVQLLLDNDADVNFCGESEMTPLMIAAAHNLTNTRSDEIALEIVRVFIAAGAKIDAMDHITGRTALNFALRNPDMVQLLIQFRCDVNVRDYNHGQTTLMIATRHGQIASMLLLIKAGVDVDLEDYRGWTAMDHARFTENLQATHLLESVRLHRDGHLAFATGNNQRLGSESMVSKLDPGVVDIILKSLREMNF
jgi:ankyrin repeat protein